MVPTLAGDNAFAGSNTFNESLNENTDVNIDNTNANQGNISPGLRFGSASGEGIASQRNKGANQYGLDFYTGYSPRMQIAAGGQVGVGIVPTGTGRFEVADGYFDFDDDPTGVKVTVSGSDESAAILGNNSEYSTLVLYNAYTAAKPVGSFFEAFGDNGLCGIDVYSNLDCDGTIYAAAKDFKIDDPLDPANKYLVHSSVESSELMNIYSGNVTTDSLGVATVTLPDWFQAENGDFRYQLTTIGRDAHAWVSQEVADGQFKIATNATNVKVSWQITAVRQDGYSTAHPLVAEVDKPDNERGFYRHPELFGQPTQKGIAWKRRSERMNAGRLKTGKSEGGKSMQVSPSATLAPRVQAAQVEAVSQPIVK